MPPESEYLTPIGRHVVTAAAYAGMTKERLAAELKMAPKTLQRRLQSDFTTGELATISRVTGAPEWFLRGGFHGRPDQVSPPAPTGRGSLDEKVDWLVDAVEWCVPTLGNVSEAVGAEGADEVAAPSPPSWLRRVESRDG